MESTLQTAAVAPTLRGLSEAEVAERRARGQGNSAPPPSSRSYSQIVYENVVTFINGCLFFLGAVLLLLGRPLDALISTTVIVVNILVSVVQEIRAKRTLDHIALLTRPTATVVRDGTVKEVPPEAVVVGDVLKIGLGDQVVVDGTVLDGEMAMDESQLTGESDLIPKKAGAPIYSGSFCVSGTGYYVAEKVGAASVANQITAGARAFRRVLTPLQHEVHLVIRLVLLIAVYMEFLLVLNAVLHKVALSESVQNSALIAALVPNGLFLSISVAYALAAVRIVRFGALVQQSNAIESLSNTDVLCLDKTGTLTANKLKVNGVHPLAGSAEEFGQTLGDVVASISSGTKTSEAMAAAFPGQQRRRVREVAFSSARKWSAVALDDNACRGVYAFGAPELLQPYLGAAADSDSPAWQGIQHTISALAAQGLRVLLLAHYPDPVALAEDDAGPHLPTGMTPLGLISLSDELRPEAREALMAFRAAGVHPKIISGDNPETVTALARQAGLGPDLQMVAGPDLEGLDDDELQRVAVETTVFGRITPQMKERIVKALRDAGHYVAMIGDGVNDVLSLKQAHLGIAMHSGSQATRGVADIVLLNDSFAVMVPAVAEGQRIINGMQDILKLFVTRISSVGLLILSSLVVGVFPLALRQGSVVTLLTVAVPTIFLAVWARPGETPKGTFAQRLAHFVLPPAIVTTVIGLVLFYGTLVFLISSGHSFNLNIPASTFTQMRNANLPEARTTLTCFLTFCGLLLVIFVEPPRPWWTGGDVLSADHRPTYLAIILAAAFAVIMLVPSFRHLFDLSPLGAAEWGFLAVALVVWMACVRLMWRRNVLGGFLGLKNL